MPKEADPQREMNVTAVGDNANVGSSSSSDGQGQKRARPEDVEELPSHSNKKATVPSSSTTVAPASASTSATTSATTSNADDAAKKETVDATKAASKSESGAGAGSVNNENIIDIAQAIDLKPGSRIEVRWDLHFGNTTDTPDTGIANPSSNENTSASVSANADNTDAKINPENSAATTTPATPESVTQTRWWGGTLLHSDGRMHTLDDQGSNDMVQVPIRVIDYDPYIEGGFPDRSLEDVCFLTDHSLLNMGSSESESRMWWRKESDTWMPSSDMDEEERKLMAGPVSGNISTAAAAAGNMSDDEISVTSTSREDALKVVLNSVLQGALQKAGIGEKMNQLHPSQQSFMAEKIARAKEKLAENLMKQLNNSATAAAAPTGGNGAGEGEDGKSKNGAERGNGNGDVEQGVITKEHVQKCMEELKDL